MSPSIFDGLEDFFPKTIFERFIQSDLADVLTVEEELWLRQHPQPTIEAYSRALHLRRDEMARKWKAAA